MPKIFLSHSSAQATLVRNIANRLGFDNCVIDQYHFEPGDPTLQEIFNKIDSADLFVSFLSDEALNSVWVKRELDYVVNNSDPHFYKRLQIFIIDNKVDHNDERIPKVLRTKYDLKYISDISVLLKKIDSKRRDIAIEKFPNIVAREEIFIGRNDIMDEFESKYYNLDNIKPTAIIASGMQEVGRRKFIKNALDRVKKINKFHNPITISLSSRDSIEDFILRLEDLNSKNLSVIIDRIRDIDLEAKISYARQLMSTFKEANEVLFIIDNGCLIQANKQISAWFNEIIESEEFKNITIACVIASIRPSYQTIRSKAHILSFHVNALSPTDTRKLFIKYIDEVFKVTAPRDILENLLMLLNGMPGQVYYAAELLSMETQQFITKKFDEIKKYNDVRVFSLIEEISKEGKLFSDILIFISKIEFIGFNLIYSVYGRTEATDTVLEKLYAYGVYEYIGSDREYIRVHSPIVDYIARSKLKISADTKAKLRKILNMDSKHIVDNADISQVLLTIKSMVEDGISIPDKLLLPSFALRTIIANYYDGKYEQVEVLSSKFLERDHKYDPQIIREIRYWLCQAYAKFNAKKGKEANNDKFYQQLKFFEGSDYYFLLGFYQRFTNKINEAEQSFRKALELDEFSQKAKRELMNVLLRLKRYDLALPLAKENYESKKLNSFHIQAYFICLTRKIGRLSDSDKVKIKDLMESMRLSHDNRSEDMYRCMKGEYKYYVEDNLAEAIKILTTASEISTYSKNFPRRALLEIYRRKGLNKQYESLQAEIQSSLKEDDYDIS